MKTKKAGCILINKELSAIAVVHREKQNDYSFPKGHMEKGETLRKCAVRETMEETKRKPKLVSDQPVFIEEYVTPLGEEVEMYYYLAVDNGRSDNESTDTHELIWLNFDEVEDKLTYTSLKKAWNAIKDKVEKILKDK